ncbi:alanine--tRNA ligase [soil metagenome]
MESTEIRRRFLSFFEERGHRVVPSSSLIPNDPTLLLTNAGMNQFKPYFLGLQKPPYVRAASVQKVFRTSDIENVGHTDRHCTFFEMLGNFSFGDYFKREACRWGWELSTDGFGLDPERLWVTIFEADDETDGIWRDEVGVPAARIVRRGADDNFWDMGVAGPCGPSSEIFYDRGPEHGEEGGPAVDEDRYLEFWNLVFIQNVRDDVGNVTGDLPNRNIDTGLGLERLCVILQKAESVFQTDLLASQLEVAQRMTGIRYESDPKADVSLRVIAEHGRATTFLIADGVVPSNEGRGYVLRRMLRRLVSHARRLGVGQPVMAELVDATVDVEGEAFPELVQNRAFVLQVAASEEERFGATYRQGMALLEGEIARAKSSNTGVLPGDAAFKLHDTFGFQEQLTIELAAEEGLAVDTEEFARLMEEQRRRAQRAAKKGDVAEGPLGDVAQATGPTEFVGYERTRAEARLVGMVGDEGRVEVAAEGRRVRVVLDRTPFYAEGGGQVGDAGSVRTAGGSLRVSNTRPGPGGIIVHEAVVESGEVRQGEQAEGLVDEERREATARSHTATHVLHHTIRQSLGEHARQAGSLVAPGRLRFDFTHFESVPRRRLEDLEYVANRRLADDEPVRAYETTYEFARSQGAIALFGEKYGDVVRVVEVGDYSVELCGGTHVHHTGQVALLRLVSEASIGSGLRRVEAVVGPDALRQINLERRLLEEVKEALGGPGDAARAPERIRHAMGRIKQLESELGAMRRAARGLEAERLAGTVEDVEGVSLVVAGLRVREATELRELALALRGRLEPAGPAAAVLGSADGERALLVAVCTYDLIRRGVTAPALIQGAAEVIGGRAGGKPALAIGGGSRVEALPEALGDVRKRLSSLISTR